MNPCNINTKLNTNQGIELLRRQPPRTLLHSFRLDLTGLDVVTEFPLLNIHIWDFFRGTCLLFKLHNSSCAVHEIMVTILSFTSWTASLYLAKIDLEVAAMWVKYWRDDKRLLDEMINVSVLCSFQENIMYPHPSIPGRLQAHSPLRERVEPSPFLLS